MKDHFEISNLTKFYAFKVNRAQVKDIETWFTIYTTVSDVETAFPDFCDNLKNGKTCVILTSASCKW